MNKRVVGIVLLAVVSFALGLACAQKFFHLFQSTVPPVALGTFQVGAAHAAFLTYGAVLGAVFFGFGILTCFLAPMFRGAKPNRDGGSGTGSAAVPRG